jgi:hypothetical protein
MRTRSPAFTDHFRFLESVGVGGGHDLQILDLDRARLALGVVMRLSKAARFMVVTSAWRKLATRYSVARQSAMALKLSMNQRSDDCACVNAPAAIIRPPNETLP